MRTKWTKEDKDFLKISRSAPAYDEEILHDPGDHVTRITDYKIELGFVKEIRKEDPPYIYYMVVYNWGDDWENYEDYTGASTREDELRQGWPQDWPAKEMISEKEQKALLTIYSVAVATFNFARDITKATGREHTESPMETKVREIHAVLQSGPLTKDHVYQLFGEMEELGGEPVPGLSTYMGRRERDE